MKIRSRKLILVFTGLILLGFGIWFVVKSINSKTINISTEEGASIYVAPEKSGDWTLIGVGSATYKTQASKPVFFQALKNDRKTVVTVNPSEKNKEVIEIQLDNKTGTNSQIVSGPLVSLLREKGVIYGINADTHSLVSVSQDTQFKPSFIGLPFMDSIVWSNSNNFIYKSFGGDVGVFSGGSDRGFAFFKPNGPFIEVRKYYNRPIILLGTDGIYSSPNFNLDIQKLYDVDTNGLYHISVDNNFIYFASYPYPGDYAPETEVEIKDLNYSVPNGRLTVLTYSGDLVVSSPISNTFNVSGVTQLKSLDDGFVMSSNSDLLFITADNSSRRHLLYFSSIDDLVWMNDNLYLFTQNGIWKYDVELKSSHLVFEFSQNQNYIPNSAVLSKNSDSVTYTMSGEPNGVFEFKP